jgi:hypothetical protein
MTPQISTSQARVPSASGATDVMIGKGSVDVDAGDMAFA